MDENNISTPNGGRRKQMTAKQKTGGLIVIFRWFMIIIVLAVFFSQHDDPWAEESFLETMAVYVVFNLAVTIYTLGVHNKHKNFAYGIIFADIALASFAIYTLGGIDSDIYIVYYFVIGYCGIYNNIRRTVTVSAFCILLYTLSCLLAGRFAPQELSLVRLFAKDFFIFGAACGITMINREVKKFDELHKRDFMMARTDKLTGLANRHYFEQKIKEVEEYSNVTGKPLNFLMFDLDNFKKFNDTYGHVWGDKLLTEFAIIITRCVRSSDIPVRYGGEEFLIILRDLDIKTAGIVADRIRSQLEKQHIFVGDEENRTRVTVSCGVAQYPMHSRNIRQVVEFADMALYHSKNNGKNMVTIYDNMASTLQHPENTGQPAAGPASPAGPINFL